MKMKQYSRTALRKLGPDALETILHARGLDTEGSKTARINRIIDHQKAIEEGGPVEGTMQRPVLSRRKKHLACKLTEGEWTQRASRMAQVDSEINVEKEHQKDVKAQLRATMTSLEAERSKLSTQVRNRTEYRDVPIRVELDDDRGLAIIIREDTGEQINERPLTDEERQLELPEAEIDFGAPKDDDTGSDGGTSEDGQDDGDTDT